MNENSLLKNSKYSPLMKYTRSLLRKVNKVLSDYNLIKEGDRVLVAVSGGKDSLSLLHLLTEHRRFFPVRYEIGAIHVVSDFAENAGKTREYLKSVFSGMNIPYSFPEISVIYDKEGGICDPSCFWCSWNRRKALFEYTRENGYNKLALAHHFDDVAETILLNLFYHGNLDSIIPKRAFFDGAFDVIRPLFYVRERELVRLASLAGFLSKTCTCTHADTSKRRLMKNLISGMSKESKYLHWNLWRAAKKWYDTFGEHPLHKDTKK